MTNQQGLKFRILYSWLNDKSAFDLKTDKAAHQLCFQNKVNLVMQIWKQSWKHAEVIVKMSCQVHHSRFIVFAIQLLCNAIKALQYILSYETFQSSSTCIKLLKIIFKDLNIFFEPFCFTHQVRQLIPNPGVLGGIRYFFGRASFLTAGKSNKNPVHRSLPIIASA